MPDIFLCHAPAEEGLAGRIAALLEHTAEARVWLEPAGAGESVVDLWDRGLACAAVVLLLSPASVPERSGRESWGPVLDHRQGKTNPPVAVVLAGDCAYPRLLERSLFFRWTADTPAAARELQQWAITLHKPTGTSFHPALLPHFDGRESEVELLFESLADRAGNVFFVSGPPESGKTALAQEFARRAGGFFRDVVWLACGGRTLPWLGAELSQRAGIAVESEPEQAWARAAKAIASPRTLVVLDDADEEIVRPFLAAGRASVLVTCGSAEAGLGLELERRASPAIQPPAHEDDVRLWRAISVCSPREIPLDFAAEAAGVEHPAQAAERLVDARLADPVDVRLGSLRLSRSSRRAAQTGAGKEHLLRRHVEALRAGLSIETIPQLPAALRWALAGEWEAGVALGRCAFKMLHREGRVLESVAVMEQLRRAAERRGDDALAAECNWELSWFQDGAGALRQAPASGDQLSLF